MNQKTNTTGQLASLAYTITAYGWTAHGAGHHIVAIIATHPKDMIISGKYTYTGQAVMFWGLALPKMSICATYLRVFYSDVAGRRMIQGLLVLLVLLIVPFWLEAIFQCHPIDAYWNEARSAEYCNQDLATLYVNGALNIFVDIALLGIVAPRVFQLQIDKQQKNALLGLVCLGSMTAVAGIIRMVRVGQTVGNAANDSNFDVSWDTYDVPIWILLEVNVSLICAAAPGTKPLVSKLMPKFLEPTLRSRTFGKNVSTARSYEMDRVIRSDGTSGIGSQGGLAGAQDRYAQIGRSADGVGVDGRLNKEALGRNNGAIWKTSVVATDIEDKV